MAEYWTSFSNFASTSWTNFYVSGTIPIWECRFKDPDWGACWTNWYVPVTIIVTTTFLGFIRQRLTQWSFFSTLGTPQVSDSFYDLLYNLESIVNGEYNVYTIWYVVDIYFGMFFSVCEVVFLFVFMHFNSSWLIMYNLNSWTTSAYPYLGLLQYLAYYPFFFTNALTLYIDALSLTYLERNYPTESFVKIRFATLFNQTSVLGFLVYLF